MPLESGRGLRFSANLSLLFTELPLLERFTAAKQAGFAGVEIQFPYDAPLTALVDAREASGLPLVLHNLPAGDRPAGELGIAALPGRQTEFQHGVGQAIEYARALGCRQLNVLAGVPPVTVKAQTSADTLFENLKFAAAALQREGITLLLEPINTRDVPGFYLSRCQHALDIIAALSADNVRLQFDLYHMHIMEQNLAQCLRQALPWIGHVQLADWPGRHQPGTGEIPFDALFQQLRASNYQGWVGAEYYANHDHGDPFSWLPG